MKRTRPPKIVERVLCILSSSRKTGVLGDSEEEYRMILSEKGFVRANLWYIWQILRPLPLYIRTFIFWSLVMFKNYIKLTSRNIKKQKGYSFINIFGLALGITCCVLILKYVQFETSYDHYHLDAERIYRINTNAVRARLDTKAVVFDNDTPTIPKPLIAAIREDFPQVEVAMRIIGPYGEALVSCGTKMFYEKSVCFYDPEVFDLFSIPFIEGNPETSLKEPNTLVLTQNIKEKYFGEEKALGKFVRIQNFSATDFEVTGVVEDPPLNTHLEYDILISLKTYSRRDSMTYWGATGFKGYVKLREGIAPSDFEQKLDRKYGDLLKAKYGLTYRFILEPIKDIHLNLKWTGETDPKYLYAFSFIALLILIIACVNFMNLTTARSGTRMKEIGVKKVVGVTRRQLMRQFLSEAVLMSVVSSFGALLLIRLTLPLFNILTEKDFTFGEFLIPSILFPLMGITILVGLFSGSYPAFFLSSFKPINVLKGSPGAKPKRSPLRKFLLVTQFSISTFLILSTVLIVRQIGFMKNTNLGFEEEQKIVIPFSPGKDYAAVKNEFLQYPGINGATASGQIPGKGTNANGVQLPNADNAREQVMDHMYVDFDFFKEYQIELSAGRFYKPEFSTDIEGPFILNDAAVKAFGWGSPDDAIGQSMMSYYDSKYETHPIIGVVKDFNFDGLQVKIKPLVMILAPERFRHITLSVDMENLSGILSFVRSKWEEMNPNDVFSYFFVDEEFNRHYRTEERLMKIFGVFSAISIVISCLGLFGLVAFMTEKRSKEIGVRKVLGASEASILFLFSKDFSKWVILANIFSWPTGFYVMNKWLQNFAYRIKIDIWTFAFSGGIVFLIALLSISYQSLKAALADPVDSLRYE